MFSILFFKLIIYFWLCSCSWLHTKGLLSSGACGFSFWWLLLLWHMTVFALCHMGSFQAGDWACVSCIGRWVLNHCCCWCCKVASVVSNSVRPHRRQPTRHPSPWDSPGKNTGVGCHFLLQCMKGKVKLKSLTRVRLLGTP